MVQSSFIFSFLSYLIIMANKITGEMLSFVDDDWGFCIPALWGFFQTRYYSRMTKKHCLVNWIH